jgi:hypothetical protein
VADDSPKKDAFNIDNPYFTQGEVESGGSWHAATLATGMLSFLLTLIIVITSLPILRRKSYNTFYYAHIICSSLIFIGASIHCSTDFYFLLPGLLLWLGDWIWRLFWGDGGLRTRVTGSLEMAEGGWCRIILPAITRLRTSSKDGDDQVGNANHAEKAIRSTHPLQTYHVNIPSISKLQSHAFTAATIGSTEKGPVLLFQRSQLVAGRKQKKQEKEWTWKAIGVADDRDAERVKELEIRLEGPYYPPEVHEHATADTVCCIVGGTGLTGAYSLADWWLENRSRDLQAKFVLLWSIRHRETAELSEWLKLTERASSEAPNMEVRIHVTSEHGRLDIPISIRTLFSDDLHTMPEAVQTSRSQSQSRSVWVYCSGPAGLLNSVEEACVDIERELRRSKKESKAALSHYIAKWEV